LRVAVYYNNKDIRLEERPVPKIGPGELLVRVEASGICGSDVMEWYRVKRAPLVLGHEIAGEVAEVGDGVKRFKVGDRVVVAHHVPCNSCHYCLKGHHSACDMLRTTNVDPGGFSEYIRVPAANVERGVLPLPPDLSIEEGAFVEPLACAVRGQRLAGMRPGSSVLVLGSGSSGLLHIQLARSVGASRVFATDLNEYRLAAARRFGADEAFRASLDVPELVQKHNDGRGADLVIACTAAPSALQQAMRSVDRGGTILFFAPTEPGRLVPVPLYDLWHDEVSMVTSYAGPPGDMETALALIRAHAVPVKDMVTHRLGLGQIGEGFRLVAEAAESLKVMIEPQN